jgi:hypothetical protein
MPGRKPHAPTDKSRAQVEAMAGYGLPQDQIAKVMRIGETTLKKHYAEELSRGSAVANSIVGEALFKQARGGNTTAMIFWAKTRMGWKETTTLEHTSPDGSMSPADNKGAIDELTRRLDSIATAKPKG